MENTKLRELYVKYELTTNDVYKHKHYVIITRQGIEKIQAKTGIIVTYEVIKCEAKFAVIKATANIPSEKIVIETFGSALKGDTYNDGNCNSWYVAEMAEKRALSRAILKLTGFYEQGVFGEDESEDFKKK
tara:strand:- start:79 stop:471 length:393 start_codon:yes stop_codon:yes gene_type:complete